MPRAATDISGPDSAGQLSAAIGVIASGVVVAALYFGQELFVPLVLAGLLAFILAPLAGLLQRAHVPRAIAVLSAVVLAFGAIGLLGAVVAHQIGQLAAGLPRYEATVLAKWHRLTDTGGLLAPLIGDLGLPGNAGLEGAPFSRGAVISLAERFAQPVLSPLATAGVVLVFVLFILLYSEDLRDRFVRLVGRQDLHRTIFALNDAGRRLSRYFLSQLLLNASFGTWIGVGLLLIGLPGAVLWGILAMLMRFVPFIGIFIAVVPPLAIATASAPGWSPAILVLALFLGSELVMGQVIEPQVYGHNTGLSPIAVIVATGFWALIWGAVGLLLATPLTVCLVVIGRHVEQLAFFDVMLGDTSPLTPAETFYQRALEGRSLKLARSARAQIAAASRAEYYDDVALPALRLAQCDRVRDTLAFERLESVHQQIDLLLRALNPSLASGAARDTVPGRAEIPQSWRRADAVLCVPGRGQLDDLAASMAGQTLQEAGFGARCEPNLILDGAGVLDFDLSSVRLCCLSVLEAGASPAAVRYFVRRTIRVMPKATIVVGLWKETGDSALLAALRSEGGNEHLVLSIGELLAFMRAICNQREAEFV